MFSLESKKLRSTTIQKVAKLLFPFLQYLECSENNTIMFVCLLVLFVFKAIRCLLRLCYTIFVACLRM
jgi:hypothetical protein